MNATRFVRPGVAYHSRVTPRATARQLVINIRRPYMHSTRWRRIHPKVQWLPDGSVAAAAGKTVTICDAAAVTAFALPSCSSTVLDITWSPSLRTLLAAEYGAICMFPMPACTVDNIVRSENDGHTPTKFEEKGSFLCVRSAPIPGRQRGCVVAAGMQDAMVMLCTISGGRDGEVKQTVLRGFHSKVTNLAFDASGQYMATGGTLNRQVRALPSDDRSTRSTLPGAPNLLLWDLGFRHKNLTGSHSPMEDYIVCTGSRGAITGIAFHPRLPVVAACTKNGSVMVISSAVTRGLVVGAVLRLTPRRCVHPCISHRGETNLEPRRSTTCANALSCVDVRNYFRQVSCAWISEERKHRQPI